MNQASEPFKSLETPIDATERSLEASISAVSQEVLDRKAGAELNDMLQLVDAAVAAQAAEAKASIAPAAPQGIIAVNTTEQTDPLGGRRCARTDSGRRDSGAPSSMVIEREYPPSCAIKRARRFKFCIASPL